MIPFLYFARNPGFLRVLTRLLCAHCQVRVEQWRHGQALERCALDTFGAKSFVFDSHSRDILVGHNECTIVLNLTIIRNGSRALAPGNPYDGYIRRWV